MSKNIGSFLFGIGYVAIAGCYVVDFINQEDPVCGVIAAVYALFGLLCWTRHGH